MLRRRVLLALLAIVLTSANLTTPAQAVGPDVQIGFNYWSEYRPSVAFLPDGRTAMVTDEDNNRVLWIDLQSMSVTRSVTVRSPIKIVMAPDGSAAYVLGFDASSRPSRNFTRIDPVTGATSWSAPTDVSGIHCYTYAKDFTLSGNGEQLLATSYAGNS